MLIKNKIHSTFVNFLFYNTNKIHVTKNEQCTESDWKPNIQLNDWHDCHDKYTNKYEQ